LHKNQDHINVLSKAVSHIKTWLNIWLDSCSFYGSVL
jgi:hypothetical protein